MERPTGATWISVYRSNAVRADLDPLWAGVSLDLEGTCNGDIERALKVIVWDHRRTGKHKAMGEFETTMRGLIDARVNPGESESGFTLLKHDKEVGTIQVVDATLSGAISDHYYHNSSSNNNNYHHLDQQQHHHGSRNDWPHNHHHTSSTTEVGDNDTKANHGKTSQHHLQHRMPRRPEFVDYLSGGCQISLAVAIDFTASNGDPRQPNTPHYFHPPESKEWNDYEKAIFAVGSILAKYDSDQQFPVWGFGAKYNNVVRHCFQCGSEVEVQGVQGIMDAYRGVFRTPLTMSYPTKFTEVIQTAAAYARHEQVRDLYCMVQ